MEPATRYTGSSDKAVVGETVKATSSHGIRIVGRRPILFIALTDARLSALLFAIPTVN